MSRDIFLPIAISLFVIVGFFTAVGTVDSAAQIVTALKWVGVWVLVGLPAIAVLILIIHERVSDGLVRWSLFIFMVGMGPILYIPLFVLLVPELWHDEGFSRERYTIWNFISDVMAE